jgi:hypothetical protein
MLTPLSVDCIQRSAELAAAETRIMEKKKVKTLKTQSIK